MSIPDLVTIGTSIWSDSILNQGMITRTPNGDLYASCGDMGQNHDLSISEEHPIEIWYSNDDGATWSVSKTIYETSPALYDYKFGGGGNGVCLASDQNGTVHIAYAIRRPGDHYLAPDEDKGWYRSRNIVRYWRGKHGDWGIGYNVFQLDHYTVLDCLPKVTSLAVDSDGLAHILHEVRGATEYYNVYHLYNPGSGQFTPDLIAIKSYFPARSRMVIDGNDTVHVTYVNEDTEKCYYKQKAVAGGWGSSTWIGMDSDPYYYAAAMAVDEDNTVHFAVQGVNEGGKGYYRQRSSAGVWSSIEEFTGINYGRPTISVALDGAVYIISERSENVRIAKRDPDTEVWSTDEFWDAGTTEYGICLLHSYWPKIGTQYINILETGWAFHIRLGHYISYYKADFTKDAYVTTDPATLITAIAATLNGTLVYDGEENCTCGFDYGLTDSYGSQIEALESYYNTGETFAKLITDLLPATTYHFRARATNSAGTFYGADLTFTTIGGVFPSEATTRVSALIHRWVPGSYTLEAVLGGLTSEYGLRVPTGKPSPTIPDIPSCPPGYVLSWSLERGYFCIPEADIPPVYPETMEEYY